MAFVAITVTIERLVWRSGHGLIYLNYAKIIAQQLAGTDWGVFFDHCIKKALVPLH